MEPRRASNSQEILRKARKISKIRVFCYKPRYFG